MRIVRKNGLATFCILSRDSPSITPRYFIDRILNKLNLLISYVLYKFQFLWDFIISLNFLSKLLVDQIILSFAFSLSLIYFIIYLLLPIRGVESCLFQLLVAHYCVLLILSVLFRYREHYIREILTNYFIQPCSKNLLFEVLRQEEIKESHQSKWIFRRPIFNFIDPQKVILE